MTKKKYIFWITGLPGSGKTSIAKKIHKRIEKKYGPTIEISGDELRKNFLLNKYNIKNREEFGIEKILKDILKYLFNLM